MGARNNGRYHHGDLRAALLEGALALIEEDGVSSLSLRAVARRVGVSPGAPYHHFASRSALLAAISMDGFTRLHETVERAIEANPGPERLDACGVAYVRFALAHPGHFRVMFRPELTPQTEFPEVHECATPLFQRLVELVQEGQRDRRVPAGDWQPHVLLAWAACHGLASLLLDGPIQTQPEITLTEDEVVEKVVKTFGRMIRAAAGYR